MYLHYQLTMPFSSENQTSHKATSISCISSLLTECLVKKKKINGFTPEASELYQMQILC